MSNAIMTWAKTQMTGSPSAQCVLYCLADEASTHGECWTSQETLARETQQSVDSVQRRLRELEKAGYIHCVSRRHWGDSGKWRTNMIVVLADAICVTFALKHGYDPAARGASGDEKEVAAENQRDGFSTIPQIAVGESIDANENNALGEGEKATDTANCGTVEMGCRTAPVAVRTVPHSCGTRTITLEPDSPQSPPSAATAAALDDGSWLGDWEKFLHAWPWAAGELPEQARRKFRDLVPEDRAAAVGFIPAYLADMRRRQGKAMQARRWVSLRGWEPFVLAAKRSPTAKPGSSVPVIKDSEAWKAWLAARGARSFPTRRHAIGGRVYEVWDFPTLWPPGAARNAEKVDGRAGAAGEGERNLGAAR